MVCVMDPNFLRAILEAPHEDALRLILADHLEEAGELVYPEFIRLQVDGTQRKRERELFDRLQRRFLPDPWDELIYPVQLCRRPAGIVTRGFVGEISCSLRDWLKHGERLCKRQPVEGVRLWDRKPRMEEGRYCWDRYDGTPENLKAANRPPEAPGPVSRLNRTLPNLLPWEWFPTHQTLRAFPVREGADKPYLWLSHTAVNWARGRVGLGPL